MRSGSSAQDPYHLNVNFGDARDPGTRTQVDGSIQSGESTGVILTLGQSNGANAVVGPYTPSQLRNNNFNIADGGVYVSQGLLLGCNGVIAGTNFSNVFARVADKMILAGIYTRVILVPLSIGGTTVADWAGTGIYDCKNRVTVACERLVAAGLSPDLILWHQGEADAGAGTSESDYQAALLSVIANIRSFGFDAKFLVSLVTHWTGTVTPGGVYATAIRSAQGSIVNHSTGIWAGPDTDTIPDSSRADGVHWNATGADQVSSLWLVQIGAAL